MSLNKIRKISITLVLLLVFLASTLFFIPQKVYAEYVDPPANYEISSSLQVSRDQGSTELCWAYSGARMLESYYQKHIKQNSTLDISEEWISLCKMQLDSTYDYGGANFVSALAEIVGTYGIVSQADYNSIANELGTTDKTALFDACEAVADKTIISNSATDTVSVGSGSVSWIAWIGYYNNFYASGSSYNKDSIVKQIKYYLTCNGALTTAVNANSVIGIENTSYFIATLPDEENVSEGGIFNVGHALTIIGYDDSKTVTYNNKTYTGMFKTINSYGDGVENQPARAKYVYIPYDMFTPYLVGTTDHNDMISNTYCVLSMKSGTGTSQTTYPAVLPAEKQVDPTPVITDPTEEELLAKEAQFKKSLMVFAGVGFLLVVLAFALPEISAKVNTKTLNKRLAYEHLVNYEHEKDLIEIKQQELDEELERIRQEQIRKKQRRLKRMFDKVQNMKNSQPNIQEIEQSDFQQEQTNTLKEYKE